jgi:hypothetical protein
MNLTAQAEQNPRTREEPSSWKQVVSHLWALWEQKLTSWLGNPASQQGRRPSHVTLKTAYLTPLQVSSPLLQWRVWRICAPQSVFMALDCIYSCQITWISAPDILLELLLIPQRDFQHIILRSSLTLLSLAECVGSYLDTFSKALVIIGNDLWTLSIWQALFGSFYVITHCDSPSNSMWEAGAFLIPIL